ncbi:MULTISPECIES: hypothetical protein [Aphanothece]|uniref:hypothetical protein n=1 Tax=Aphanothece TaxID=1121 RepID=UPI003984F22C
MSRPLLTGSLAALLCLGLSGLPGRAEEASSPQVEDASTRQPDDSSSRVKVLGGSESYTSYVSEVDACNRAQMLRPAGTTVTGMRYWRLGRRNARATTCSIRWSDSENATPTYRPILFGRSS